MQISKNQQGSYSGSFAPVETGRLQDKERSTATGKKKICSYCGRDYHTVDRCYYIHGFPPGHKLHGKDVKPRGKKPTAHNSTTDGNFEAEKSANTTLTSEEYNQLMALLRKDTGNISSFANTTGHGYEEDDWPRQAA
ncbi:hypothetical protein LWI29_007980 [Acer saccharum]|uniref:Uncharacterized protein n=1 Tax=Acer saccharum TaxID=4024 RepID=A0AA39VWR8_ACESA|nr:hypothetical protein LWI29_007980 [Acer saccharum]